jgi:SNF2 family DNA or RNA helicase
MRKGEVVRVQKKVNIGMADLIWDVGILDESTAIKTPGAKVSKFFRRKMGIRTKYRAILTGSAYTKRPLDVWAQVNFACRDEVFTPAYEPFKSFYAIPNPYIRGAVLGYRNLDDLVQKLAKVAILLKKEDMFDLPPFVHETRIVELEHKSRKVYTDMVTEQVAEIEALEEEWRAYKAGEVEERPQYVTADHVFTLIRKLTQITSGFVYPDPDEDTPDVKPPAIRLGTEKLKVLLDILDERESPTIVVTQANEEERIIAEAVRKRYGFKPKILNGSVEGAEARHKMIQDAANDKCFIVKESVGARGVDMRFADMTIFFSHSYNTEGYEQILSRNHRGGQTKNITYIHLICKDSIDVKIMSALQRDLNIAAGIEQNWREIFE